MAKKKRAKADAAPEVRVEPSIRPEMWTQSAFVLTLALMIARAMVSETVREGTDIIPGIAIPPRGTGPAATLFLDGLCCVPALLVLLRRVIDRQYTLRWSWSQVLLAAVAVWSALSIIWSTDKFTAMVYAATTLSAATLVWSTAQLVRSWLRLRILAGVCFGLLLAYAAQGLQYRLLDVPENVKYWNEHKQEILQQHDWAEGSFNARQFEKKLTGGEMIGFNTSPNSFAAVIVLMWVIVLGFALEGTSGDAVRLIVVWLTFIPIAIVCLTTHSRTAVATATMAATALLALFLSPRLRSTLARHSRRTFWIGLALFVLATAALVGHGVYHGSLPQDSLNFRWRYWVAAARLVKQHPLLGIGWGNFGDYYTAVRMPIAAEEVRDPHNLIVRGFCELGIIGGILLVLWLARAIWELTRPVTPIDAPTSGRRGAAVGLAIAVVLGVLINTAVSIDFAQPSAYITFEVFRRVIALGLIFIGVLLVVVRGSKEVSLDDRPAPWVLYGLVIAIGMFLIHCLMDFVIAEPGPMTLFAVLLGAGLGLRSPPIATRRLSRGKMTGMLIGTTLLLVILIGVFAIPVANAEQQADEGDNALQANRAAVAAGLYRGAARTVPVNGDYAYRAARALLIAHAPLEEVKAMLEIAIAADPRTVLYHLTMANAELTSPQPVIERVRRAYDTAVELDPQNIEARLDYAAVLEKFGLPREAADQYRAAMETNAHYHPDEPKRLSPARVREIEQKIEEVSASQPTTEFAPRKRGG